jgi:hypothetical protein
MLTLDSGNWRREDTSAPSLLTKSCHDIDFLLWLLCSPTSPTSCERPHLPSTITSSGSLNLFRKARKPAAAGNATNCLSCPIEKDCIYSAKRVYIDQQFEHGNTHWPVKIVVPDIEDIWEKEGKEKARKKLLDILSEDYTSEIPNAEIKKRNWFGRCVWECDNDVCDDQLVTLKWDDDSPISSSEPDGTGANGTENQNQTAPDVMANSLSNRAAKTAYFHMISSTQQICERRGHIFGTTGEISYDSSTITLHDFLTNKTTTHRPPREAGGHGGGDSGLAINFVNAVKAVKKGELQAENAQEKYLGCSLEEVVRSHVAVFAAEKARRGKEEVAWKRFWDEEVERKGDGVAEGADAGSS